MQLYARQGHFWVCLTLPSNMGRVETLLDEPIWSLRNRLYSSKSRKMEQSITTSM